MFIVALRLISTWAPELKDPDPIRRAIATRGREWVRKVCTGAGVVWVWIPFTGTAEPLKNLSFDRVPAWVWAGDEKRTLNARVVSEGFASTTKGGPLGK